jgi:hypothetical protein
MMKKVIVSFIVVIFTTCLYAQVEKPFSGGVVIPDRSYRISAGPKVGLNFSTMGEPDGMKLGLKGGAGFNGGIAANLHLGRRMEASRGGTGLFGLQIEALYAQRKIKSGIEDLEFTYLEVPLLAQCYVTPKLSIEAGATVAGITGCSPGHIRYNKVTVATGEFTGMDVMLTLGLGYKDKSGLTVSARYNLGTSDMAGNFPARMNMLTLSAGWLFTLIK